jgi:ABC-2 type transport system ATP-binding protein
VLYIEKRCGRLLIFKGAFVSLLKMISVTNLIKRYGTTVALQDVNFDFRESTVTAIMGENGAGKSTLLKICAGVLTFDCGQVEINGHSIVTDSMAARRLLGYLPEMPYMYDRLTGREFLLYIASLRKLVEAEEEIDRLADLLGMVRFLDNELGSYSKGMKQKISLMSALMHKPKNLLLDEPVWGLDPLTSRLLRDFIKERKGTTVIATHSPQLVEDVADIVYFLSQGVVLSFGEVAGFIKKDGSIEAAYFSEAK